MTASIDLLSVFADVVILLALAAALASPRRSQLARPLIATSAFACAWLLTAVFAAMRVSGWTTFVGGAVIAVSIVVITATLHVGRGEAMAVTAGPGNEAPMAEVGRDVVGRMLRLLEVAAAPRTGGRSSSANSRCTLPSARRRTCAWEPTSLTRGPGRRTQAAPPSLATRP
jgi:hypothetical protein